MWHTHPQVELYRADCAVHFGDDGLQRRDDAAPGRRIKRITDFSGKLPNAVTFSSCGWRAHNQVAKWADGT
jgi:hypothetical protein